MEVQSILKLQLGCTKRASENVQSQPPAKYCHCIVLAISGSFVSSELAILKLRKTMCCFGRFVSYPEHLCRALSSSVHLHLFLEVCVGNTRNR